MGFAYLTPQKFLTGRRQQKLNEMITVALYVYLFKVLRLSGQFIPIVYSEGNDEKNAQIYVFIFYVYNSNMIYCNIYIYVCMNIHTNIYIAGLPVAQQ